MLSMDGGSMDAVALLSDGILMSGVFVVGPKMMLSVEFNDLVMWIADIVEGALVFVSEAAELTAERLAPDVGAVADRLIINEALL